MFLTTFSNLTASLPLKEMLTPGEAFEDPDAQEMGLFNGDRGPMCSFRVQMNLKRAFDDAHKQYSATTSGKEKEPMQERLASKVHKEKRMPSVKRREGKARKLLKDYMAQGATAAAEYETDGQEMQVTSQQYDWTDLPSNLQLEAEEQVPGNPSEPVSPITLISPNLSQSTLVKKRFVMPMKK